MELALGKHLLMVGALVLANHRSFAQGGIIEAIRIQGNRVVAEETYRFHIQSKVGDPYDKNAALADYHRLWKTGFLDDLILDVTEGESGKVLTFIVTERPRIERVEFTGSGALDRTAIEERLREREAELQAGTFYDPARVVKATNVLRVLLVDKGFPDGDVKVEVKTLDDASVAVAFDLREEEKVRIGELRFEGAEAFREWRLQAGMKDRKSWWIAFASRIPSLLSGIVATGGGAYSEDKLSEELENLRELYLNHGFVDVSFGRSQLEYRDGKRRFLLWKRPQRWVRVTIPVYEGLQYRVGRVAVDGESVFSEEAVMSFLDLESGQVYDESRVTRGLEKLRELYGSVGHVQFTGFPVKKTIPEESVVDVTLQLEEDKQYFVNRIELKGNTRTRDKVVRRELWLNEQDVLNMEVLKASIRRINQLGYFRPIEQPEITPADGEDNKLDITLRVSEENRNQLSFGGGLSGLYGSFVNASFSTTNFLGRGETFTVGLQAGTRNTNYQFGFTQPYFFDRPITAGVELFKQEVTYLSSLNLVGYTQGNTGLAVTTGFPLTRFSRLFATYSYQIIDISEVDEAALGETAGGPATSATEVPVYAVAPLEVGRRHESQLTPSLVRNTVDHPITPRSGTRYTASLQFVGGPLQGTVNYYRPTFEAILYRPFGRRTAVGLRGQYGYIQPFGTTTELPYYHRYFLGGENQIRGYDIRTVAPYTPRSNTLLGGDEFVLFNAEYYVDVAGPLRLVFFYDAGEAYLEGQNVNLRTLRSSTGSELRFFVPILNVPFRLIFAYNPNRDYWQPATAFKFAIGPTF